MRTSHLPSQPLAEAYAELRWAPKSRPLPAQPPIASPISPDEIDPEYTVLVGALFAALRSEFPHHIRLPSAQIPSAFIPHLAQHQFRPRPDGWPLVQVGSGVLTVNQTSAYTTWSDFRATADRVFAVLWRTHPTLTNFPTHTAILRYINAVSCPPATAQRVLRALLGVHLSIPPSALPPGRVDPTPADYKYVSAHRTQQPPGLLTLSFGSGNHKSQPAIVWEFQFDSDAATRFTTHSELMTWLDDAHATIEHSFFGLLTDEATRRFSRA